MFGLRAVAMSLLLALLAALTSAQTPPLKSTPSPSEAKTDPKPGRDAKNVPETRTVAAGRQYRAGPFHRFIFGEGYRKLWGTKITVDVLNVGDGEGGLKPKKKGGGKQTKSLTFESGDGREWKFRSIDKDTSAVLREDLRDTFVDALVQDQVSAAHPLGPLIVDPLSQSLGILGTAHRLVLLPDDDSMGGFRKEFGGSLGFLEEKIRAEKTPGFEDYHKLLDTVELWKRLEEHPEEKVDAPAILRARLFDMFINDFDRHKDQWQWARKKGSNTWQPIPEDRDQAFVRYSGLALSMIRPAQPRLVDFGRHYPRIFGLTWQGRFIDRRHLAELEWAQWDEAVKTIQASMTDSAIDEAVNRLPEEYRPFTVARTARDLKSRRSLLPEAARKFYEQLANDVEIHGTDETDIATVRPGDNSLVEVRLTDKAGAQTFMRRFDPKETNSIRLYLKGGDDQVFREAGTGRLTLRVIGGAGDDTLDDSKAGGTHFYDEFGKNRVLEGSGTTDDGRPYTHPIDSAGNPDRDWGRQTLFVPWVSGGGDLGLFVGGNAVWTSYAFRHHPYARKHTLGAGYATGLKGYRAEYRGEFVRGNGTSRARLHARASEVDLIRFYGFGNDTKAEGPDEFFKIRQQQFSVSPQYLLVSGPLAVSLGVLAQYTKEPQRTSFASLTRPYGFGGFGKVGPKVDIEVGRRDHASEGPVGGRIKLGGSFFPSVWSVTRSFGEFHAEAGAFLRAPIPLRPTLAVRVGGKRVYGQYPFQEAAFLGGPDTVRGLRPQRYAGDASAFGSAELRLRFGRATLLLPADFGVFGLIDSGRVFRKGERSDTWHTGVGGGVWVAVLKPENTVSLAAARSEGATRLYFRAGFSF